MWFGQCIRSKRGTPCFGPLESHACKFWCSVQNDIFSEICGIEQLDQCKITFVYSKCRGHSYQPFYCTLDYYTILTKIIFQVCKCQCNLINRFKERNLNCVCIIVSTSRSQSWAFQGPPT